jgi:flagellar biosynthesis chaperone FliJ
LLQEIQRFNLEQASNVDNSKLNTASKEAIETYDNPNNKKEEDVPMGNILFHEVCSKIKALLAEHSFKHKTGKNYDKYVLLNICEADKSAIVVDREDSYCAFKVPYVATKTADGLVVNLDYDNKTTMALGATESTDCVFKVKEEVEMIANDLSAYEVEHFGSSKLDELNKSLEESKAQFETAQARVAELEKHLAVFEKEKIQYMEQKHKDIIDTLVASRREEMGKFSEYLDYCIKIDYKKTVEQVEKDIKEIHYNFMLKNNKGGGKKSYSAIEVDVAEGSGVEGNSIAERYGEDIAKYFK